MIIRKKIKTYTELLTLKTAAERFEYLRENGRVCDPTFGPFRYLNQKFYTSPEWRIFRNKIILRDNGCDMALDGYTIQGSIYIHHLNPITADDIVDRSPSLMDPDNVVCVSFETHQAITYGSPDLIPKDPVVRYSGDTCPWRK